MKKNRNGKILAAMGQQGQRIYCKRTRVTEDSSGHSKRTVVPEDRFEGAHRIGRVQDAIGPEDRLQKDKMADDRRCRGSVARGHG